MRVRSQRCVLWSAGSTPSVCTRPPAPVAEALEDLDGGGLAGAVGPEQREDLALLHLEADVAHGHGVPVGLGQVLHAHRRHRHPVLPETSRPTHARRAIAPYDHHAADATGRTAPWPDAGYEAAAASRTRGARSRPRYLVRCLQHLVEEVAQLAQLRLRQGRERRRRHREHPVDLGGDRPARRP